MKRKNIDTQTITQSQNNRLNTNCKIEIKKIQYKDI